MWYLKVNDKEEYMFDYYCEAAYEAIREMQKEENENIKIEIYQAK